MPKQSAMQPSPLMVLPSSQASLLLRIPSPQPAGIGPAPVPLAPPLRVTSVVSALPLTEPTEASFASLPPLPLDDVAVAAPPRSLLLGASPPQLDKSVQSASTTPAFTRRFAFTQSLCDSERPIGSKATAVLDAGRAGYARLGQAREPR